MDSLQHKGFPIVTVWGKLSRPTIHLWWRMRALLYLIKANIDALHERARKADVFDTSYHAYFAHGRRHLQTLREHVAKQFWKKVDANGSVVDSYFKHVLTFLSIFQEYLRVSVAEKLSDEYVRKSFRTGQMLRVPSPLFVAHPDVEKVLQLGKDIMIHIMQQCAVVAAKKNEVVMWRPVFSQEGHQCEAEMEDVLTIKVSDVRIDQVHYITKVSARLLTQNPFGPIAYELSKNFQVRYYDPVQQKEQCIVTAWSPPHMECETKDDWRGSDTYAWADLLHRENFHHVIFLDDEVCEQI